MKVLDKHMKELTMNLLNRTYTQQDMIELFNGDYPEINGKIAKALNKGEDVGNVIRQALAEMTQEQEEFEMQEYIESGEAERDRRQEIYEMLHDLY